MDMLIQDEDSSGLQLQLSKEAEAGTREVERLVIAHQLPRLVVMGGVRTWRARFEGVPKKENVGRNDIGNRANNYFHGCPEWNEWFSKMVGFSLTLHHFLLPLMQASVPIPGLYL